MPRRHTDTDCGRAAKASVNRSEVSLWDLQQPEAERDSEYFRTKILPGLQGVPVPTITGALGVTYDAAWRIRRGDLAPHPRHWEKLSPLPHQGSQLQ